MESIRPAADASQVPARARVAEPAAASVVGVVPGTGRPPTSGEGAELSLEAMRESFRESVDAANERLSGRGTSISMAYDKDSGTVIVQVRDQRTGDTVRQIPSQDALQISRNIERLTGIMVDQKA
jgi:flagellar protein FlaG